MLTFADIPRTVNSVSTDRRLVLAEPHLQVFNEIMDRRCPRYDANPASLSEKARMQILRGIGVAIVKHGSSEC